MRPPGAISSRDIFARRAFSARQEDMLPRCVAATLLYDMSLAISMRGVAMPAADIERCRCCHEHYALLRHSAVLYERALIFC